MTSRMVGLENRSKHRDDRSCAKAVAHFLARVVPCGVHYFSGTVAAVGEPLFVLINSQPLQLHRFSHPSRGVQNVNHRGLGSNVGEPGQISKIRWRTTQDVELKTRFREIGLWEEKLRRLKFDRGAGISSKRLYSRTFWIISLNCRQSPSESRDAGSASTRLKSVWQELAAIEAKIVRPLPKKRGSWRV